MNQDTLKELKEAARKATPGPWRLKRRRFFADDEETPYVAAENHILLYPGRRGDAAPENDVAFCAAANPAAVLELIAEIERRKDEHR